MRRFGYVAVVLVLTNSLASHALAQNGSSFIDAQRSPLNYRLGGVAPRVACKDLARLSDGHVTILSTEVIAPAGDIPEFCRVLGIVRPEVKFEVALPTSWNSAALYARERRLRRRISRRAAASGPTQRGIAKRLCRGPDEHRA